MVGKISSEKKNHDDRHPLGIPFPLCGLACCRLCGALVPQKQMEEHFVGDELMLRIIHHNHPDWTPKECLDYYIRTYRPGTLIHP
jgi:hypothetical protein